MQSWYTHRGVHTLLRVLGGIWSPFFAIRVLRQRVKCKEGDKAATIELGWLIVAASKLFISLTGSLNMYAMFAVLLFP